MVAVVEVVTEGTLRHQVQMVGQGVVVEQNQLHLLRQEALETPLQRPLLRETTEGLVLVHRLLIYQELVAVVAVLLLLVKMEIQMVRDTQEMEAQGLHQLFQALP
jgi:hypothetical protein